MECLQEITGEREKDFNTTLPTSNVRSPLTCAATAKRLFRVQPQRPTAVCPGEQGCFWRQAGAPLGASGPPAINAAILESVIASSFNHRHHQHRVPFELHQFDICFPFLVFWYQPNTSTAAASMKPTR